MDLHMPVGVYKSPKSVYGNTNNYVFTVDGESAARHIKSTNNKNSSVPIIAVSAYGIADGSAALPAVVDAARVARLTRTARLVSGFWRAPPLGCFDAEGAICRGRRGS